VNAAIDYAWLIPVFPFLGFLVNVFYGTKLKDKYWAPPIVGMFGSLLISTGCLLATLDPNFQRAAGHRFIEWVQFNSVPVNLGYQIDALAAMMLMVVTFIGGLIFIYSVGYMAHDPRRHRFFAYLSLFAAAMLILVLSDGFIGLFIGWEGVGLCSYFLIGFWFEKPTVRQCAKKAFLITRLGDAGMALGMYLLYSLSGRLDFDGVFEFAAQRQTETVTGLIVLSAILVWIGPVGKSAQFPLHIWLPDAMAGPTPVSALIHAATMVAAGVYLIARLFPLFAIGAFTDGLSTPLTVVGYVGALTAVVAATIGVVNNDIKKVLAYSTVSQLGFMMAALGCGGGGYIAGVFHLMTHAFFKALLFLGSGSVIHAVEHGMHDAHVHADPQDMWNMGGLRKCMKTTYVTYLIGALALSGFPLMAGFWSKDEILHHALDERPIIGGMLAFAAFLTAFYMTRQMFLVFGGEQREFDDGHGHRHHLHIHDSPLVMTVPLMILAVFSLGIGLLVGPTHKFQHWMIKSLEQAAGGGGARLAHHLHSSHDSIPQVIVAAMTKPPYPMTISLFVATVGFLLGFALYGKQQVKSETEDPVRKLGGLHTFFKNLWYLDFYEPFYPLGAALRQFYFTVAQAMYRFDQRVIDATVNTVGITGHVLSRVYQLIDIFIVDGLVNLAGWATKWCGDRSRRLQTGLAQNYMLVVTIGVLGLICVSRMLWAGAAR